jgi:hypothetical protein
MLDSALVLVGTYHQVYKPGVTPLSAGVTVGVLLCSVKLGTV